MVGGIMLVVDRDGAGDQATISPVAGEYPAGKDRNSPKTTRNWPRTARLARPTTPVIKPTASASKPASSRPKPASKKRVESSAPVVKATSAPAVPARPGPATAPSGVPVAGVPAGTALKAAKGGVITRSGTVIDGADISGGITVAASNVVIRRSRISGSDTYGVYVRSGSLTIQDTTITGFENALAGDNYTAAGLDVSATTDDGFKIGSNVSIVDSWCHDLATAPGAHADCGQVQSGISNVVIRGNWFDPGNKGANAALFIAPDLGPSGSGPLLVEGNVFGGGNYSLFCVDGDNRRYYISGITLRNNRFLRNSNYGPIRVNVQALVSGNTWRDTGAAITID